MITLSESADFLKSCGMTQEMIDNYGVRVIALKNDHIITKEKPNFSHKFKKSTRYFVNELKNGKLNQIGKSHTSFINASKASKRLWV